MKMAKFKILYYCKKKVAWATFFNLDFNSHLNYCRVGTIPPSSTGVIYASTRAATISSGTTTVINLNPSSFKVSPMLTSFF